MIRVSEARAWAESSIGMCSGLKFTTTPPAFSTAK